MTSLPPGWLVSDVVVVLVFADETRQIHNALLRQARAEANSAKVALTKKSEKLCVAHEMIEQMKRCAWVPPI